MKVCLFSVAKGKERKEVDSLREIKCKPEDPRFGLERPEPLQSSRPFSHRTPSCCLKLDTLHLEAPIHQTQCTHFAALSASHSLTSSSFERPLFTSPYSP